MMPDIWVSPSGVFFGGHICYACPSHVSHSLSLISYCGERRRPCMSTYDLIIVGGGPGGLTAGIYAMRAALKTILIEKGIAGGQVAMSDSVENYPGIETTTGFDLSQRFLKHAQSYGLGMVQDEVISVEPGLEFHTVRLANGTVLQGYAVVLGMGGSPRKLGIAGEKEYYGRGVSYCAVCDGFFFRDKTVVVVGGGDTATEEALYLAKLAKKVYLVHRRDA